MNSCISEEKLFEEEPKFLCKHPKDCGVDRSFYEPFNHLFLNKDRSSSDKMRSAWAEWISLYKTDLFLTINLKKSDNNNLGICHKIQYDDIIYLAKYLRNNLTQKLTNRYGRINFFPFLETSSLGDRYHLHILFSNEKGHSLEKVKSIVDDISNENHWLYNVKLNLKKANDFKGKMKDNDLRNIYHQYDLVNYCVKKSQYLLIAEAIGLKQ